MLKKNMVIKENFFELEGFKVDQYKNYFEIITVLGLIEFIDNKDLFH